MKHFIFHTSTGAITRTCSCDDQSFEGWQPASGETLLELTEAPNMVTFAKQNYVLNGKVVPRQTMAPTVSKAQITSDGVDSATINGLPDPCTVSIAGPASVAPTVVTGGSITLTSNAPGAIEVSVTAEPAYLPWSTTINAV